MGSKLAFIKGWVPQLRVMTFHGECHASTARADLEQAWLVVGGARLLSTPSVLITSTSETPTRDESEEGEARCQ